MRYGCVYVQISICHMLKNRKPPACFFAFPLSFLCFYLSHKACLLPEHLLNTLSDVFALPERARTANANILVKKAPKTSWVCFIQQFPKENKQDEHNGKNAWSALWGLLNDSNKGQRCQVLYSLVSADSQKFSKYCLKELRPINTDFLIVYIKLSSFKDQTFW